jgi:hypothetical protein
MSQLDDDDAEVVIAAAAVDGIDGMEPEDQSNVEATEDIVDGEDPNGEAN